jgi:hypothetical protein
MTRKCIHLGVYNRLVFHGISQDILNTSFGLFANQVSKTSIARNPANGLAAGKEF